MKRFDIPAELGGVNRLGNIRNWAERILGSVGKELVAYQEKADFTFFFPEAHLLSAKAVKLSGSPVSVGCQGVYREDVAPKSNFGAFTTNRPASAAKALGCQAAIIGHCEERADLAGVLKEAKTADDKAVNRILNREVAAAQRQGLKVVYCIGEKEIQRDSWQEVLQMQLETGLAGVCTENVAIAYEPVWAIGPGKTPPDRETIRETAVYIKSVFPGCPVVYGGGLKKENAAMLASVPEIDGALIALTRFSGEIGFYPEEFLQIVSLYMEYGGENNGACV